jgi:hypothetical protein
MAAVASCRITEPETTGVSGRKSLFERRFCRGACMWRMENDRPEVRVISGRAPFIVSRSVRR